MRMRLSHMEACIVALLLIATAVASGGKLTDWLSACAVLFTFMHAQISFDFQESQEKQPDPSVPWYKLSARYFVTKEILWLATFIFLHAWTLLAGTVVFASYPLWRRAFRRMMTVPVSSS